MTHTTESTLPPLPGHPGDNEYAPKMVPGDPENIKAAYSDPTEKRSQKNSTAPLRVARVAWKAEDYIRAVCGNLPEDYALHAKPPLDHNDPNSVEYLLKQAMRLYRKLLKDEHSLLKERIELGKILIRLKHKVGHGNFLNEYSRWVAEGKIGCSYATANRAMAYAELDSAGKISSVRNLAEAEKVRRTEAAKAKADTPPVDLVPGDDESPLAKLTPPQIGMRARQLAKPALQECDGYNTQTRMLLLEELIEVFSKELEKITEEPEA